jgi:hypothetical protein
MTTTRDNSNVTDKDVLEAKTKLANAIQYVTDLTTSINSLTAWLKKNDFFTLFASMGNLSYTADGLALKNDLIAPEGSPTPANAPWQWTFTTAERIAYLGVFTLTPSVTSVWVMKYDTKYGTYYEPNRSGFNSDLYYSIFTSQTAIQPYAASVFILNDQQAAWWKKQDELNRKQYSKFKALQKIDEYQNTIDNGPEINLTNSDGTLSQRAFIDLVYNVGSVKEAYLSSRSDFLNELTTLKAVNAPSAVTNASQLWVSGFTNKGMIQPYTKLAAQSTASVTEVTIPGTGSSAFKAKKFNPTGFQFLYNPASVDMNYSGMLGVDPNMETNGLDQFNPLGVYTQATINFNILINRMFDFRYYNPSTGVIDKKYKGKNIYYPRQPETSEQKDIYKKGTMYDVEHLLRAVLGFGMPSYLGRNMSDGQTADLGFITGIPVELHLGSNLRYLGNVTDLKVSHVLFDERMVPIFTNLAISFARLVDPIDSSQVISEKVPTVKWGPQNPLLPNGKYKYPNSHLGR